MKINMNVRLGFMVAMVAVSASMLQVFGGYPIWPPVKHSAEYRQANMLFLRFQDALAVERWQDALSLCSDRVRAKAAEWPSPGTFFKDTIPIDFLLAQDFGYWQGGSTFYGLLVPLTEPESKPRIQWYWAISAKNQTWVVDYPPVKIDEYIARKKAAIQEREDKIKQIRQSLEPKVQGIRTHLISVSERFIIGSPMLFRVELTNRGQTAVDYWNSGVAYSPLTVLDDQGRALPYTQTPAQINVHNRQVESGASVVLADRMDLNKHYVITKPGKYVVQFSGADLEIGEPVPNQRPGPFGENEIVSRRGFVAVTNRFPSNVIKIEVTANNRQ